MERRILFCMKQEECLQLPLSLDIQHFYDSSDSTLVDGLVSNVDDSGSSANADFSQAVAINQPPIGYDKVGNFVANAANLTFDGSNLVSSWANVLFEPNSRALGALTQPTASAKPLWNSGKGSVDFATGCGLNSVATITASIRQYTMSLYIQSDSVFSQQASYQSIDFIIGDTTSDYMYIAFQSGANNSSINLFCRVRVSGVSHNSGFSYNYTQLNTLLSSGVHMSLVLKQGSFCNGKYSLDLHFIFNCLF